MSKNKVLEERWYGHIHTELILQMIDASKAGVGKSKKKESIHDSSLFSEKRNRFTIHSYKKGIDSKRNRFFLRFHLSFEKFLFWFLFFGFSWGNCEKESKNESIYWNRFTIPHFLDKKESIHNSFLNKKSSIPKGIDSFYDSICPLKNSFFGFYILVFRRKIVKRNQYIGIDSRFLIFHRKRNRFMIPHISQKKNRFTIPLHFFLESILESNPKVIDPYPLPL